MLLKYPKQKSLDNCRSCKQQKRGQCQKQCKIIHVGAQGQMRSKLKRQQNWSLCWKKPVVQVLQMRWPTPPPPPVFFIKPQHQSIILSVTAYIKKTKRHFERSYTVIIQQQPFALHNMTTTNKKGKSSFEGDTTNKAINSKYTVEPLMKKTGGIKIKKNNSHI